MSVESVRAFFSSFAMEDRVREFPVSSATVAEAAVALGCEERRIAKTMAFRSAGGEPVLVVMAGDAKVDNAKYKAAFRTKAVMIKGDELPSLVGHPAGGVCPFAVRDGVTVYLDVSLKRFATVFPACGSANSAIELTIAELERYSASAGWVDIGKGVLTMDLQILAGDFSICRLPSLFDAARLPVPWFAARTDEEISLVCLSSSVPASAERVDGGWNALRVSGELDFSPVGILASLTGTLSGAGIPVFAVSTFNTDYLLIRRQWFSRATEALRNAGHTLHWGDGDVPVAAMIDMACSLGARCVVETKTSETLRRSADWLRSRGYLGGRR